ncbi:MAG: SGNH/GDSL hydrolase family protein [Clostridia bacterium]|nr:SGNH/GDSL hydrolase family protein [Clostridia bacterium]
MELNGLKANFLGDSITEGYGVADPEKIYLNVLKNEYGLAEARNYGIGGTRLARELANTWANNNDDKNMCARSLEMDPDADLIVLFGGSNDFGHGTAPRGLPTDRTRDTFWGACHEVMRNLIERYPDAIIVVLTPLHRHNENDPHGDFRTYDLDTLSVYADIIRTVAEYYSLPVLDLYKNSGIQPEIPVMREKYMPDGLHPNDAGHRKIAERLANFLRTL